MSIKKVEGDWKYLCGDRDRVEKHIKEIGFELFCIGKRQFQVLSYGFTLSRDKNGRHTKKKFTKKLIWCYCFSYKKKLAMDFYLKKIKPEGFIIIH